MGHPPTRPDRPPERGDLLRALRLAETRLRTFAADITISGQQRLVARRCADRIEALLARAGRPDPTP